MVAEYAPAAAVGSVCVLDLLPDFPAFFYELAGFWDDRPRFTYMSSTRYITGHDVTHWELDYTSARELIHPHDLPVYIETIDRARIGEPEVSMEYRERNVGGEYIWVREVARRADGPTGEVLTGFCVDVTASRAQEARLQERERRLRAVMATAASQVLEFDESGRLTHMSPATINGFPAAEFTGGDQLDWLSFVVVDDRARVRHVLLDAFERRTGCDVTFRMSHCDGSPRFTRFVLTYFAGQQDTPGWTGVLTDITPQMALARRAQTAETLTRAVLHRTGAKVYRWLHGCAALEMGADRGRINIHRDDLLAFDSAHAELVASRGWRDLDFRWKQYPTDEWRWVRATAWSVGDGDSALGVFVPDDTVPRERALTRIADALTIREQDVLERLADGSSNRELAAALHLSEKTVSHHVANLLDKLGLPNRSAAAALAARLFGGTSL